jgi:Derlin-2/3
MAAVNLLDWYYDMPPVTRAYLTACTVSTVACALELLTPFQLYYNWHAIWRGGQAWRLGTNFLFFGSWGIDFLFHMYFLVNYCRKLEESTFAGRPGDFAACLLFGMTALMAIAPWVNLVFFGRCVCRPRPSPARLTPTPNSALSFMLVYLFARAHAGLQIQLLGLIPFTAPYLPWALLAFSALLGHDVTTDVLGIAVGHVYYFLEDVYPALARARGWKITRVFPNPSNLGALWRIVRARLGLGPIAGGGGGGAVLQLRPLEGAPPVAEQAAPAPPPPTGAEQSAPAPAVEPEAAPEPESEAGGRHEPPAAEGEEGEPLLQ